MTEHYAPMIVGEVSEAGRLEVYSPYDRSVIATVSPGSESTVDTALETAYRLFRNRQAWLPVTRRIEILERCAKIMEARDDFLAVQAAREGGKPLTDSRIEVARAIESIRLSAEALRTGNDDVISMGLNEASLRKQAWTTSEPIGVVVAISAFNHPLNLIAHQVGPAVAAGCPVIVKPADDTPLSCFHLVSILRESGLPEGWCQALLTQDHKVAQGLACDPRVGFLSFIGSARVGWMLRSRIAAGTRCALEHGGAAPVIVAADADFDDVEHKLLKGGFYHAGQVCVSVQRVFVHASRARELATRLADGASRLKVGDPTNEQTEVGPLIRPKEVQRVHSWVGEAIEAGAELLTGGQALSATTYACTVLYDPPDEAKVSRDEIFGPVVCVYPYDDLDEAIARANALPWAFQAAVFSKDLETIRRTTQALDASAIMVNDHTAFRVDWMPFAGLRQSGLGVGGIPYTFHDLQVRKMIVFE